jgi:hypothetical protein
LTIKEGMNRVQRANEGEREGVEVSKEQPRKRAASRCSICGTLGHTARTCSQRTGNNSYKGLGIARTFGGRHCLYGCTRGFGYEGLDSVHYT